MLLLLASRIMPRTTLNIEKPILTDLKRLQKQERKSLGKLVSELLAQALAARGRGSRGAARFDWISRPMKARLDLRDKEAVYAALDREDRTSK
jgi:hypothetical protein